MEVLLEVTEDADVCELFAVAMSRQGEQERPLQAHEAPHTGQVQTVGVSQRCFGVDSNGQEGKEGDYCQQGEENSDAEEELESL